MSNKTVTADLIKRGKNSANEEFFRELTFGMKKTVITT